MNRSRVEYEIDRQLFELAYQIQHLESIITGANTAQQNAFRSELSYLNHQSQLLYEAKQGYGVNEPLAAIYGEPIQWEIRKLYKSVNAFTSITDVNTNHYNGRLVPHYGESIPLQRVAIHDDHFAFHILITMMKDTLYCAAFNINRRTGYVIAQILDKDFMR